MTSSAALRFDAYFECLGSQEFATAMAPCVILDEAHTRSVALSLSDKEILAAASCHGDIGQPKEGLDARAAAEQAKVFADEDAVRKELRTIGAEYREKFGIKFMISAKGRSGSELLVALKARLNNSKEQEWTTAREEIFKIAWKRLSDHPLFTAHDVPFRQLMADRQIGAAQLTVSVPEGLQTIAHGASTETIFEMASLSKSVGTAFAMEYFTSKGIPLSTKVNDLLKTIGSTFRLKSAEGGNAEWAVEVTLHHLMRHNALNLHYVKGIPLNEDMPPVESFLHGIPQIGLEAVCVINKPGTTFKYSGAGFIVLQYVLEIMGGQPIEQLCRPFLDQLGMQDFSFDPKNQPGKEYAVGKTDANVAVPGGRLMFPAFAAGALSTTTAMHKFLCHMSDAFHSMDGSGPISNETARLMLHDLDSRSLTCMRFMGCKMGTGIFVLEGKFNKFMIHQGANDGFRVIFLHCFSGPDRGKGLTLVCTADLAGVAANAIVTQKVLASLEIQGIDWNMFGSGVHTEGLRQEEVVNRGYREMVFDAFLPNRAEEIIERGPAERWSELNVAVGGAVQYITNDRFARAENLLCPLQPIFDPELFGIQGKVMDSWESVRHNPEPYDEMLFILKSPSPVRYVSLSTMWHWGNHTPFIEIIGVDASEAKHTIVPFTPIDGHSAKYVMSEVADVTFTAMIVRMKPDGGFSRLGLYASLPSEAQSLFKPHQEAASVKFEQPIPQTKKPLLAPYDPTKEDIELSVSKLKSGDLVDVASMAIGGVVTQASNEHYSPAKLAITPFAPVNMFDGMESSRSRIENHFESLTVKLAWPAKIRKIEIDFTYFVNNNPLEMEIFGSVEGAIDDFTEVLVSRRATKHFAAGKLRLIPNTTEKTIAALHVKCYPCGGFNRIHVFAIKE